ncbi:MAG TPA: DUF4105 domain-containing protein [Longimicrobiales bacterium]|nr:DUF4105 domain-containing protein [Longimicrobiales bacterium]
MLPHSRIRRAAAGAAVACTIVLGGIAADVAPRRPSHDRNWTVEQARMPHVHIEGTTVAIRDVRDFRHHADGVTDEAWHDDAFDVNDVARVWFVLSPFSPRLRGLAHPFLSFEFNDGRFLAVSVEARKEVGESYSAVRGLMRRYETMVVIGTEADLLGLRAVAWQDPIYLFPVNVTKEQAADLFLRLMERARALHASPEFYHTVLNNCTTNLIDPINEIAAAERRVGRLVGLVPGYSYEAAYRRGWIDTDRPLEETRAAHLANDRIRRFVDEPDFSRLVRGQ